jgi:hypothetical protein
LGIPKLTISKIPGDFAPRAKPFSASGLISFATPVGQIKSGNETGMLRIVLDVSTTDTSFITLGLNQILLSIALFASRVQQSVSAVE